MMAGCEDCAADRTSCLWPVLVTSCLWHVDKVIPIQLILLMLPESTS